MLFSLVFVFTTFRENILLRAYDANLGMVSSVLHGFHLTQCVVFHSNVLNMLEMKKLNIQIHFLL